ncbi:NAD(+) diphosphatase [Corynebacterium flavescens]|uniref:NAD(+) diphosphatase n=1 Tax=Corynebacterium flavescens TaxID=28028 RepID=UPI0026470230|nr:NAD(+) diphosphatase [Corynebacterium flavescens]MDN6431479.1 NUDIX domain-containing protein [Corynebacterium flavescens]MDN6475208.1 NUDIX domain-containing protein [Corynebacterium flavescens]MDN6531528.1 NUDIX domain-containing protein [Corynebacterium flavescens]MDN6601297.1 NUDIX domain-containing protein [Corynebacterium flavescens]MDN6823895.1 NUDIX domain-containing protein [Corynebacterium flavescens]
MYLPVTATGRVPVDGTGLPLFLPAPTGQIQVALQGFVAFLIEDSAAARLGQLHDAPYFAANPQILRAIALIRNRREQRFDPRTGKPLEFPEPGIVGHDADDANRQVFPRLDPAVIGLITLAGSERILLARNRQRSGFYSLIAGYVESGESLEVAFRREALEETGRRVDDVTYWGSQPWPPSGSIMLGFSAVTEDVHATCDTDGELEEIRWVSRRELPSLPIARPGSIAHKMIMEWYHGD